MGHARQRFSNNAGHTRREFRQLQQQQQDRESRKKKTVRRPERIVDENGDSSTDKIDRRQASKPPWTPSAYAAFKALFIARLFAAFWSGISDCDETFNYWDPMHFLIYGKGFQTWEYAPQYGLRSYAYLLLHTVPAWCCAHVFQLGPMYVFYLVRCIMAAVCAGCESYFYVGVLQEVGANVGRITLAILIFSAGMFVSSTAFLPSTTSMYLCMVSHGAWFHQDYGLAIFATALSTYLSWPFAAILGLPIAFDILWCKKKFWFFTMMCVVSTVTILIPQILLDSDNYGKLTVAPFNIFVYNVFTNHGPDLYGTEPWTYYLVNGFLNFNVVFFAALLVWPLQGLLHILVELPKRSPHYLPVSLSQLAFYQWMSVFWLQPHKEERFLFPVYPLICLAGAVAIDTVQKLWYFAFVKIKVKNYLQHTQWISIIFVGVAGILGMSRIGALYQNYHAPIDTWMHISHMGYTEPNINADRSINLCIGKEWHRFPSSFFLPNNNWHLRFVRSEFRGQLPQPYVENDPDATKLLRPNFNDLNLEEMSRYTKIDDCDFFIDFETDNDAGTEFEPVRSRNTTMWKTELAFDFLDASQSHNVLRAYYIPFTRTEDNCKFGRYVLLKNLQRKKKYQRKK